MYQGSKVSHGESRLDIYSMLCYLIFIIDNVCFVPCKVRSLSAMLNISLARDLEAKRRN